MKRQEWVVLLVVIAGLAAIGLIEGSASAKADSSGVALKAGLAEVNTGNDLRTASPWDKTVEQTIYQENRWTAAPWELESVGASPLRMQHPLHRRPNYIGENRHHVMCNGWYYHAPENEVL